MLKKLRVVISISFLVAISFFLFSDNLVINILAKAQFVPALLSLSAVSIVLLLLITIFFGRIYCSVVCPLGIFQDFIIRISSWFKNKRRKNFKFSKPCNYLRYSILCIVFISFLAGFSFLLTILDPYSAYSRIVVSILKPSYIYFKNSIVSLLLKFSETGIYLSDYPTFSIYIFIVAIITLVTIVIMSSIKGRLYCNSICPVGTLLGLISKISIFKLRIDKQKCTNCASCSSKCKASCIDYKAEKIDTSRCILCFNCIGTCKNKGIKFSISKRRNNFEGEKTSVDNQRRTLLSTMLIGMLMGISHKAESKSFASKPEKKIPISPPGSISHSHFNKHCTSCNLCVAKCPAKILKPSLFGYGFYGILQPEMSFNKNFCNYNCTICSDVCPTGAIKQLSIQEKHTTQVGKVIYVKENCVVPLYLNSCGACAEHCPTQAIRMVEYKNGITIPETHTDLCVGCGACEYICPMSPKAVFIEGNSIHQQAKLYQENKQNDVHINDFGF